ncbi:hypothetical protein AD952_12855 [Acetobacter cerevisiae]|uniref:Uncharacterized protein n=2 Tax=Acetobacteraceae TaxID=433 RepID=A0A149RYI3_GLUOY|nr:hypothetical protein AD934_04190 [Gluconobacter oxydans]KXV70464.1 hypothetical protein AD952_12855 [Acetobacter cerevisiae]
MGEESPPRGARTGVFPWSLCEGRRAQEKACISTRLHSQIEAADFLERWDVASCDHGQCAFWSAQDVFGDRQQAGRVRFNADQMVQ